MTSDRPYSLLITDDDPESRETMRDIFEPAGFRTLLAKSGEEAIDIAHEEEIHLALMDMHLPCLTGLETIAIVRTFKTNLPAILISGEYSDDLLRQALSAQFFCVLAKPVSKNVVIYQVTRAISKFYSLELPGA